MKVTRLCAASVHGYLPLDITFRDDLTFLTGLNGSGKTSALRLLVALLEPNLDELAAISFSSATAVVSLNGQETEISAVREDDRLQIRVTGVSEPLALGPAELALLGQSRMTTTRREARDEARAPLLRRVEHSPVFSAIRSLSTPMFLGLDRRFVVGPAWDVGPDAAQADMLIHRLVSEDPAMRLAASAGLRDVHALVMSRVQDIRLQEARLDDQLRGQLLSNAFAYNPARVESAISVPDPSELERYRSRLAHIASEAERMQVSAEQLKRFLDRMNRLLSDLEKRPSTRTEMSQELMEWIINGPQINRIFVVLRLLDKFATERARLHEPLERFQNLVSGFLEQTGKRIRVEPNGGLTVILNNTEIARPITALSSGERQILVMLAHLSLNRRLSDSGVFIVDEPELSLHIDWQERFVDAVVKANPNVQVIMATHSPAIILDRIDNCVSLS